MKEFTDIIENWYDRNGRSALPWRKVSDPYIIWVSETILQQTRVAQGHDYFLRFLQKFPTVKHLATASEDDVLKVWQGLGYYSRARNMHYAAQTIVQAGQFPNEYKEIRKLKGVGDYTAAAISSLAFNQPYAVVDGNVYRVLSRFFGIHTPIDTLDGKKEFTLLANQLLDRKAPGKYNSAIMDFGALQCTPKSPKCTSCPLAGGCYALSHQATSLLPIKSKKTKVTDRYFVYLHIEDKNELLLRRREKGDIWQGLYEPFLLEFKQKPSEAEVLKKIKECINPKQDFLFSTIALNLTHNLTHRCLHIDCYQLSTEHLPEIQGYIRVAKHELNRYATPQIITQLFNIIQKEWVKNQD